MIARRSFCLASAGFGLLTASTTRSASWAAPMSAPSAAPLAKPVGKPILTITGHISVANVDDTAVFDREMLEALGLRSFRTSTPWYSQPVTFEGVPMNTLMKRVQAEGQMLIVTALNDYTSEIPMEDFERYRPILALKRDGRYMERADKGPLFVVYPFDSVPELQSQRFYSRSAWQIARMDVT